MKNNLHLHGALGLILIGVGVFVTFLAVIDICENWLYRYSLEHNGVDLSTENIFFFFLGVAHLLVGGGLLGKAQWSRRIAVVLLGFSFLGWTYIIYENFRFRTLHSFGYWLEIGLSIMVYLLLFLGLYFLGNEKVSKEFEEVEKEVWDEKILDI